MRLAPDGRPWPPDHRLVKRFSVLSFLLSFISSLPPAADCRNVGDHEVETTSLPFSAVALRAPWSTSSPFPSFPPSMANLRWQKSPADGDDCFPCLCKWLGGKQTAECADFQLAEVPRGLRAETQVVNLTGNPLNSLRSREFHSKGYRSLQKIFVSHCQLTQVVADTFHMLTNLVELDLSFNQLRRVPSEALSDCTGLRRLSLSHNPIGTLHNNAFRGLSRVGTLELNHCQLHTVESSAFRALRALEFLRMAHNRLRRLPLAALSDHLPTQLYGVNLEENPWVCDCELRPLRQWMLKNNIPLSAPPKCHGPPRLVGISWSALSIEDFACAPKLSSVDSAASAVEMESVTIRCVVDSEPASSTSVSWTSNGRQIRNMSLMSFGRQMYVIRESESLPRMKTSELTIINVLTKDAGVYTCVGSNRAGRVSGNVTLAVWPRPEFGPLTTVEIAGVTVGFVLTCVVLLGAVYMVMQQYAKYCEERAASLPDEGADHKQACNKSNYESVVSVSRGRVNVDLLDQAKSFSDFRLKLYPSECCSKAASSTTPNALDLDADLVEAIASEIEQEIFSSSRLIEDSSLEGHRPLQQSEEIDDVPPPALKSAREFSAAECRPLRNALGRRND